MEHMERNGVSWRYSYLQMSPGGYIIKRRHGITQDKNALTQMLTYLPKNSNVGLDYNSNVLVCMFYLESHKSSWLWFQAYITCIHIRTPVPTCWTWRTSSDFCLHVIFVSLVRKFWIRASQSSVSINKLYYFFPRISRICCIYNGAVRVWPKSPSGRDMVPLPSYS